MEINSHEKRTAGDLSTTFLIVNSAPPLTFFNSALPNFLFFAGKSFTCVRRLVVFDFFSGMVSPIVR
jgi:hypothetical protein